MGNKLRNCEIYMLYAYYKLHEGIAPKDACLELLKKTYYIREQILENSPILRNFSSPYIKPDRMEVIKKHVKDYEQELTTIKTA